MCVACRATRPQDEMLRFARSVDGALGFDVNARVPGRGAWTCASPACAQKALDKGGFERAFEAPVLDGQKAVSSVLSTLEGEVLHGLGLLRRAGRLVAGRDEVERARVAGSVQALALAVDLSERTRRDVTSSAGDLRVLAAPPQERIGAAIGRKPTGVLAVLAGPAADRVVAGLSRWANFVATPLAEGPRGA
ncbi:MAG TPA: DUF448 domain-containing protein [Myxococcota bacterium]